MIKECDYMRKGVDSQVMDNIYTVRQQLKSYKRETVSVAKKKSVMMTLSFDRGEETGEEKWYEDSFEWAQKAVESCGIIVQATRKKGAKQLTPQENLDILEILRRSHTYLGQKYFHNFLIAMEWKRPASKKFYPPRAKVLRPLVNDIQKLWDRELKLLAVSMPAGSGKSTLGILSMCWIIGQEPDKPNLMTGYSSQLTNSFYIGVKSMMTDPEYCFAEIFPKVKLTRSDAKDNLLDFRDDGKDAIRRIPTLQTISIEGAVTGRGRCENLLYSDDLVNGIEEGLNRDRLETKWLKYANDFRSRAKNGYIELIIGTRWSIHDPIGKLKALYEDDDSYKFVEIPALDENGESNFDYKYNVGFNTEYYNDLQQVMDEISFMCQCQQQPIERDGLAFAESSLNRYITLPGDEPDEIMSFCDVAFGGGDYVSLPVVYWYGDDGYVVDCVFDKNHYKVTEPRVAGKILAHEIQRVQFEANNGGEFYGNDVADLVKASGHRCNITSKRAPSNQSKMARIIQMKPDIKNLYFKDRTLYTIHDDYGRFMQNVTTFVETGKNRNDDGPDSLAGLMNMKRKKSLAQIVIKERRGMPL